jgi:hypothetical protein
MGRPITDNNGVLNDWCPTADQIRLSEQTIIDVMSEEGCLALMKLDYKVRGQTEIGDKSPIV